MDSLEPSGGRYAQEIREQPLVLRAVLRQERAGVEVIADEIRRVSPKYGLLAARGSSDNAARYAQYVFGVHNQLTCGLATPSVYTVHQGLPNLAGALVIGLSQSGQSPDIVRMLELAAPQAAATVAITNEPRSPLARAAGRVICLHAGLESAVPATKTYVAELMAVAMLSSALRESEEAWAALHLVADAVQTTLDLNTELVGVDAFREAQHLIVIGRGFNYATAFEAALKLSETSSVFALPFSSADFFHGPAAALVPGTPVLLIAPQGRYDAQIPRLLAATEDRGARLIVISNDEHLLGRAEVALKIPEIPEWLSPMCAVVAAQLFSVALARVKRRDPDEPPGLNKVTLTY